jgi:hypothetical protein
MKGSSPSFRTTARFHLKMKLPVPNGEPACWSTTSIYEMPLRLPVGCREREKPDAALGCDYHLGQEAEQFASGDGSSGSVTIRSASAPATIPSITTVPRSGRSRATGSCSIQRVRGFKSAGSFITDLVRSLTPAVIVRLCRQIPEFRTSRMSLILRQ